MPRPAQRADVLAAVRRLPDDRTRYVGIDGFGAAGKSELAGWVADRVAGCVVIHVDDFEAPPEWDWRRLRQQVLDPLRAGQPGRYRAHRDPADPGCTWVDVLPGGVVIVEGVSSTRRELGVDWDLTVWVDAPADVRLARVLDRDGPEMLARWQQEWIPSELAYAAREHPRQRVDLVVSGDDRPVTSSDPPVRVGP